MGTLNPNIPAPELTKALNATAKRMAALGQRLLTPPLLLLTFVRDEGSAAHRLLVSLAAERSFRLEELAASVEVLARGSPGLDANFTFTDETGQAVPLSTEMLVVLDEGRSIAQAADEIYVGTEHALGALAEKGVGTAALLRRYGISPDTMTNRLVQQAQTKRLTSQDLVALAKAGEAGPVYVRGDLMRDLLGLLTLTNHRHVVLVGDTGVGKRSLVQGLALLLAEGKGPDGLGSLIQVSESALLADSEKAVEAGWRQARDGILFLPNVERFFQSAASDPAFPRATKSVQRAFLDPRPVIIATTTDAGWNERLAADSVVREFSHRLRVPEPAIGRRSRFWASISRGWNTTTASRSPPTRCRLPRTWRSVMWPGSRCRRLRWPRSTGPAPCSGWRANRRPRSGPRSSPTRCSTKTMWRPRSA